MKKIAFILVTISLTLGFFSCTPQTIEEGTKTPQACCGEGGHIPPPPPPPPIGD